MYVVNRDERISVYKLLIDLLAKETSDFWSRSNIFLLINTGMLGATVKQLCDDETPFRLNDRWALGLIAAFGILVTLMLLVVVKRSFWISEHYQYRIDLLESKLFWTDQIWRIAPGKKVWEKRRIHKNFVLSLFTMLAIAWFVLLVVAIFWPCLCPYLRDLMTGMSM